MNSRERFLLGSQNKTRMREDIKQITSSLAGAFIMIPFCENDGWHHVRIACCPSGDIFQRSSWLIAVYVERKRVRAAIFKCEISDSKNPPDSCEVSNVSEIPDKYLVLVYEGMSGLIDGLFDRIPDLAKKYEVMLGLADYRF